MTIKELSKLRRDGVFKSRVVASVLTGEVSARRLREELGISRNLLRRWLRWDWRRRVLHFTKTAKQMKQTDKVAELKKQIAELEAELEKSQIKAEAYQILIDIALEKYGIDLRKKTGPKR